MRLGILVVIVAVLAVGCQTTPTQPDPAPKADQPDASAKQAPPAKKPDKKPVEAKKPKLPDNFDKLPKERRDALSKMLREHETVRRQQAEMKAKNNFRQGKEALAKQKYDEAITFFNRVNETIRWAPYQLSLGTMAQDTHKLLAKAKREKRAHDEATRARQIEMARQKMRDEIARSKQQKRDRLERLFYKARRAFATRQYSQAEELAKEILRVDPKNATAKRMHEDAVQMRHKMARIRWIREKRDRWWYFKNDMLESRIPYADLVRIPDAAHRKASAPDGTLPPSGD